MEMQAKEIRDLFLLNANPVVAREQAQYMRNRFPFIGLKQPQRKELTKIYFSSQKKWSHQEKIALAKACFSYDEREMWYLGCELLIQSAKTLSKRDLDYLTEIIVKSDWWDIVDTLATNVVGTIVSNDETAKETMYAYSRSENLWLRRVSIIFQLKYNTKTDEDCLFERCRQMGQEKEFFIQKAIGWALREYAKTNSAAVLDFVSHTALSNLSKREALKHF